jgi:hypothetical protein
MNATAPIRSTDERTTPVNGYTPLARTRVELSTTGYAETRDMLVTARQRSRRDRLRAIGIRVTRAVAAGKCFPLLRSGAVRTRGERLHRARVELVAAVGTAIHARGDVRPYGCWVSHAVVLPDPARSKRSPTLEARAWVCRRFGSSPHDRVPTSSRQDFNCQRSAHVVGGGSSPTSSSKIAAHFATQT